MKVKWLKFPEQHDYPAAASYLSLIFDKKTVALMIEQLRLTSCTTHKAKDILRASGYSLIGLDNHHVKKDTKRIRAGELISPIVLVRDRDNAKVIIADGYHRLCALYLMDEDADVTGKII